LRTNLMGTMKMRVSPEGQRQLRRIWSRAAVSRMVWPLDESMATAVGTPLASTVTRSLTVPSRRAERAEEGYPGAGNLPPPPPEKRTGEGVFEGGPLEREGVVDCEVFGEDCGVVGAGFGRGVSGGGVGVGVGGFGRSTIGSIGRSSTISGGWSGGVMSGSAGISMSATAGCWGGGGSSEVCGSAGGGANSCSMRIRSPGGRSPDPRETGGVNGVSDPEVPIARKSAAIPETQAEARAARES
jgi:hypothetical protein